MFSVTDRDKDLLFYLRQNGIGFSGEIAERFFEGSYGSFKQRARKLISRGLLQSKRVVDNHRFLWQPYDIHFNERYYYLGSKLGIDSEYQLYLTDEFILHQYELLQTRRAIDPQLAGWRLRVEADLRIESKIRGVDPAIAPDLEYRPDGESGNDGRVFAVEYERTRKTHDEYHRRLMSYYRLRYSHVLFVVKSADLMKTLLQMSVHLKKIAVARAENPALIYHPLKNTMSVGEFVSKNLIEDR